MHLNWSLKEFRALSAEELYAIMQLRNEVFVVEQNCVYQDADGKDPLSWHLAGWDENTLAAYARLIPPGISYEACSIGRVVTAPAYRKKGLGQELMELSIEKACILFNVTRIRIGAQLYLENFYTNLGFTRSSGQYLEDGIPHIEMLLEK